MAVQGGVTAIDVETRYRPAPGTPFVLTAPVVYAGVGGIADRVEGLAVRDGAGTVPLESRDDPPAPGGFPYFRRWVATRPVAGSVVYSYRSRIQPAGGRNGPPFGIRAAGGGVSGAGAGFLVLPDDTASVVIRVRWDRGQLAAGSIAVTSLGDGDFIHHGPVESLRQSWYLAGPAGRFPAAGGASGFRAAWIGDPPFDPNREMTWAGRLYAYLATVFRYLDPPPRFRVFMRFLPEPPFGGATALPASFMLSRGPRAASDDTVGPRETFAHEMVHQWVGGLDGEPDGVASWFSEGLTTYYTLVLLHRGGFDSAAEYRAAVDDLRRQYAANPGRRLSADSIARLGFGDEQIRHVPYQRGALYFFDLAARIRRATAGRQSLDGVLIGLFERRHRGERIGRSAFLAAVTELLGPSVRGEFEAIILRGEEFAVPAAAFDPPDPRSP